MLLFRLNVTSKKFTCFKFVLISILNPISLKIFMISFLVFFTVPQFLFQSVKGLPKANLRFILVPLFLLKMIYKIMTRNSHFR